MISKAQIAGLNQPTQTKLNLKRNRTPFNKKGVMRFSVKVYAIVAKRPKRRVKKKNVTYLFVKKRKNEFD